MEGKNAYKIRLAMISGYKRVSSSGFEELPEGLFRDIFTEYVDKMRESSEEKIPSGGTGAMEVDHKDALKPQAVINNVIVRQYKQSLLIMIFVVVKENKITQIKHKIFGALRERKHPATKNFTPHLARFELVAGFSHPRSAMRGPRPGVPAFLITGFSEPVRD
uniref:Uncharacterized protein n=1 Tax=Tetranychus urticae TaxID=32264 RepID=T1KGZ8_TETUR